MNWLLLLVSIFWLHDIVNCNAIVVGRVTLCTHQSDPAIADIVCSCYYDCDNVIGNDVQDCEPVETCHCPPSNVSENLTNWECTSSFYPNAEYGCPSFYRLTDGNCTFFLADSGFYADLYKSSNFWLTLLFIFFVICLIVLIGFECCLRTGCFRCECCVRLSQEWERLEERKEEVREAHVLWHMVRNLGVEIHEEYVPSKNEDLPYFGLVLLLRDAGVDSSLIREQLSSIRPETSPAPSKTSPPPPLSLASLLTMTRPDPGSINDDEPEDDSIQVEIEEEEEEEGEIVYVDGDEIEGEVFVGEDGIEYVYIDEDEEDEEDQEEEEDEDEIEMVTHQNEEIEIENEIERENLKEVNFVQCLRDMLILTQDDFEFTLDEIKSSLRSSHLSICSELEVYVNSLKCLLYFRCRLRNSLDSRKDWCLPELCIVEVFAEVVERILRLLDIRQEELGSHLNYFKFPKKTWDGVEKEQQIEAEKYLGRYNLLIGLEDENRRLGAMRKRIWAIVKILVRTKKEGNQPWEKRLKHRDNWDELVRVIRATDHWKAVKSHFLQVVALRMAMKEKENKLADAAASDIGTNAIQQEQIVIGEEGMRRRELEDNDESFRVVVQSLRPISSARDDDIIGVPGHIREKLEAARSAPSSDAPIDLLKERKKLHWLYKVQAERDFETLRGESFEQLQLKCQELVEKIHLSVKANNDTECDYYCTILLRELERDDFYEMDTPLLLLEALTDVLQSTLDMNENNLKLILKISDCVHSVAKSVYFVQKQNGLKVSAEQKSDLLDKMDQLSERFADSTEDTLVDLLDYRFFAIRECLLSIEDTFSLGGAIAAAIDFTAPGKMFSLLRMKWDTIRTKRSLLFPLPFYDTVLELEIELRRGAMLTHSLPGPLDRAATSTAQSISALDAIFPDPYFTWLFSQPWEKHFASLAYCEALRRSFERVGRPSKIARVLPKTLPLREHLMGVSSVLTPDAEAALMGVGSGFAVFSQAARFVRIWNALQECFSSKVDALIRMSLFSSSEVAFMCNRRPDYGEILYQGDSVAELARQLQLEEESYTLYEDYGKKILSEGSFVGLKLPFAVPQTTQFLHMGRLCPIERLYTLAAPGDSSQVSAVEPLLLLGEGGCGKSCTLRHLAYQLHKIDRKSGSSHLFSFVFPASLCSEIGKDWARLPIEGRVELLVEWALESFEEELNREFSARELSDMRLQFRHIFGSQQLALFLDAFDEVPRLNRVKFSLFLNALLTDPDISVNTVVLSMRPDEDLESILPKVFLRPERRLEIVKTDSRTLVDVILHHNVESPQAVDEVLRRYDGIVSKFRADEEGCGGDGDSFLDSPIIAVLLLNRIVMTEEENDQMLLRDHYSILELLLLGMIQHDKTRLSEDESEGDESLLVLACSENWIMQTLSIIGFLSVSLRQPSKTQLEHLLNDHFIQVMDREVHLSTHTNPVGKIVESLIETMSGLTKHSDSLCFVHEQVKCFFASRFILNLDENAAIDALKSVFSKRYPFGLADPSQFFAAEETRSVMTFILGNIVSRAAMGVQVPLEEIKSIILESRHPHLCDVHLETVLADFLRVLCGVCGVDSPARNSLMATLSCGLRLSEIHERLVRLQLPRVSFRNGFMVAQTYRLIQTGSGRIRQILGGVASNQALCQNKAGRFTLESFTGETTVLHEREIELIGQRHVLVGGTTISKVENSKLIPVARLCDDQSSYQIAPSKSSRFPNLRVLRSRVYLLSPSSSDEQPEDSHHHAIHTLHVVRMSSVEEEEEEGEVGDETTSDLEVVRPIISQRVCGHVHFLVPHNDCVVLFSTDSSAWVEGEEPGEELEFEADTHNLTLRFLSLGTASADKSIGSLQSIGRMTLSEKFDGTKTMVGYSYDSVSGISHLVVWAVHADQNGIWEMRKDCEGDVNYEIVWASPCPSRLLGPQLEKKHHIVLCTRDSMLIVIDYTEERLRQLIQYPNEWVGQMTPGVDNVFFSDPSKKWIARLPSVDSVRRVLRRGSKVHAFRPSDACSSTNYFDMLKSAVYRNTVDIGGYPQSASTTSTEIVSPSVSTSRNLLSFDAKSVVGVDVAARKIVRFAVEDATKPVFVSELTLPDSETGRILAVQELEDGSCVLLLCTEEEGNCRLLHFYLDEGTPSGVGLSEARHFSDPKICDFVNADEKETNRNLKERRKQLDEDFHFLCHRLTKLRSQKLSLEESSPKLEALESRIVGMETQLESCVELRKALENDTKIARLRGRRLLNDAKYRASNVSDLDRRARSYEDGISTLWDGSLEEEMSDEDLCSLCPGGLVFVGSRSVPLAGLSSATFRQLTVMTENHILVAFDTVLFVVKLGPALPSGADQPVRRVCDLGCDIDSSISSVVVLLDGRLLVVQTDSCRLYLVRLHYHDHIDEDHDEIDFELVGPSGLLCRRFCGTLHRVSDSEVLGLDEKREGAFWFDAVAMSVRRFRWRLHPSELLVCEGTTFAYGRFFMKQLGRRTKTMVAAIELREVFMDMVRWEDLRAEREEAGDMDSSEAMVNFEERMVNVGSYLLRALPETSCFDDLHLGDTNWEPMTPKLQTWKMLEGGEGPHIQHVPGRSRPQAVPSMSCYAVHCGVFARFDETNGTMILFSPDVESPSPFLLHDRTTILFKSEDEMSAVVQGLEEHDLKSSMDAVSSRTAEVKKAISEGLVDQFRQLDSRVRDLTSLVSESLQLLSSGERKSE